MTTKIIDGEGNVIAKIAGTEKNPGHFELERGTQDADVYDHGTYTVLTREQHPVGIGMTKFTPEPIKLTAEKPVLDFEKEGVATFSNVARLEFTRDNGATENTGSARKEQE